MQTLAYILVFLAISQPISWSSLHVHSVKKVDDRITVANVIRLTNQSRTSGDFNALKENLYLDSLAQERAKDLATHGIFSHIDSQGKHAYDEVNPSQYPFKDFGENIAILFTSASAEQRAWLQSPEHLANIFNPRYKDIGVGIATGTYQGISTQWVVVEFGNRT